MSCLRQSCLELLQIRDADEKAGRVRELSIDGPVRTDAALEEPTGLPGRPGKPLLVPPAGLRSRPVHTRDGRGALLHALAHIEFNAINLALDIVWRFAGMPAGFYRQWASIAREEAMHFELLRDHLASVGLRYGDLPAHDGLWEMASRTRHDLLARLALVPRTLEARGLDASPPIRAKLAAVGDAAGAGILDIILRDEVGHVATGNHWYQRLCRERGVDPLATFEALAVEHRAPRLRGPFNLEARRAAGFEAAELERLVESSRP